MSKVKVLEGGHVVLELKIEDALKLTEEKMSEGQSVIIDGVHVAEIKKIRELLPKAKEGISFFPMVGGGKSPSS